MCQPPVSSRPALVPEVRPRALSPQETRERLRLQQDCHTTTTVSVSPPPPPPPPPPSRPLHQPCANAYIVVLLFAPRAAITTYCLHTVPAYCLRGPPCLHLRFYDSLFLARDSRAHCNTTTHRSQGQDTVASLPGYPIYHIPREKALLRRIETRRNETLNPPATHTDTNDTQIPGRPKQNTVYHHQSNHTGNRNN